MGDKLTIEEVRAHDLLVQKNQLARAHKLVSEGVKDDGEKPMMALIPALALEEEGHVWTFGAKKYSMHNWKKGIAYTRILSASFRHLCAIMKGEDIDEETGYLHAAAIRCNMGMLIEFHKTGRTELDDRYKKEV